MGNAMGCGFHVCAAWVRISTAINAQDAETDLVRWHGTPPCQGSKRACPKKQGKC